jgi:hypothetical protein
MSETVTRDQQRENIVQQAMQTPSVNAGMAIFAAAARLSPAPQMVLTSQVRYSAGANR